MTVADPEKGPAVQHVPMGSGRTLAVSQWGAPEGAPVFYFHGSPSSRLEGLMADAAASRYGCRLLAVDRPGFGQSSYQPHRTLLSWVDDIKRLMDHFHLTSFGAVGHSGGGPYLFVCGTALSDSLTFIGALAPWGPPLTQGIYSHMNRTDRFYAWIAQNAPWVMTASFAPLGWGARFFPNLFWRAMRASVTKSDRDMLTDSHLARAMERVEKEAFRQGGRGPALDALLDYRPWGFDLADVKVPTHIWLGDQDIFVSPSMGRFMEQRIPKAVLHPMPGRGHFAVDAWDDILKTCMSLPPS